MRTISVLSIDVIFFIYLYQKWIYPIDYKRVNEFGVSGDDLQQVDNNGAALAANPDVTQPNGASGGAPENGDVHVKSE
jgi:hypothetical protein